MILFCGNRDSYIIKEIKKNWPGQEIKVGYTFDGICSLLSVLDLYDKIIVNTPVSFIALSAYRAGRWSTGCDESGKGYDLYKKVVIYDSFSVTDRAGNIQKSYKFYKLDGFSVESFKKEEEI